MVNSSRVEINKFNGKKFDLWKLKMENIIVDKEQWVVADLGIKPDAMSIEYWEKLYRRTRSMIQLCLSNLAPLNFSRGDSAKKL